MKLADHISRTFRYSNLVRKIERSKRNHQLAAGAEKLRYERELVALRQQVRQLDER